MKTTYLISIIIKNFFVSLFKSRKIKVSSEQYQVIDAIAKELKIPKEEVLWLFVEFGHAIMNSSQQHKEIEKAISKRNHLPEYKNWQKVAKLLYEFVKAGEKK